MILGTHTASYSMDTWFFPGGMWLEREADHSFPYNAELIMCGNVPLLLYVPSRCGQQMFLLHLVPLSHISGMLKLKFKCVSSVSGTRIGLIFKLHFRIIECSECLVFMKIS
jgi:hypothetical protein